MYSGIKANADSTYITHNHIAMAYGESKRIDKAIDAVMPVIISPISFYKPHFLLILKV